MANFPLKLLVSFLQNRSLQTKTSKLLAATQNPAVVTEIKSKTKKTEAAKLSVERRQESVIALLKSQQFSDTQIAKLAERSRGILRCRVANLEPKFKFLNGNGFEGDILTEIILKNPLILRRSLNGHLIPSLEYLKIQLMKNNQNALLMVVKRATWLLTLDLGKILQPNIDSLVKEGVPMSSVLKLFASQPRSLLCTADRIAYGVEMVKKFGIKPNEPMFIHALRVAVSMNELNLKKKVEVMKSLGWSDEDVISTIVHQPLCLTCSEDKLRSSMEFFVKTMKVEPQNVISYPKLVMYSLNKRTIPRCKVLMVLQEKKLLEKRMLPSLINMPEKDFVRKYISKYLNHVPNLLDIYHGNRKMDGAAVQQ